MSAVHPELMEALTTLIDVMPEMRTLTEPLLLNNSIEKMAGDLSNIHRAKLHTVLAFTINSIFFTYLKVNGIDLSNHPVKNSIDRIKTYFEKIKKLEQRSKTGIMKVDQAAAGRFIHAALSNKSKEANDKKQVVSSSRRSYGNKEKSHYDSSKKRKSDPTSTNTDARKRKR